MCRLPVRLQNDLLMTEVADEEGLFTRFDRTGTVRQIVWRGHDTFLTREHAPGAEPREKEGFGLACEFGLDGPIGCVRDKEPLPSGEAFLKPGVGWLRADGMPYSFMKGYSLLAPGNVERQVGRDRVSTTWDSGAYGDSPFACKYTREICLEGQRIFLKCEFRNTGKAPFSLSEYCHNFIMISGKPFPGNYRFTAFGHREDRLLFFEKYPGYRAFEAQEWEATGEPVGWELSDGRLKISESVDFTPDKFALWGMPHVISPEIFIRFTLEPREEIRWTRIYLIEELE